MNGGEQVDRTPVVPLQTQDFARYIHVFLLPFFSVFVVEAADSFVPHRNSDYQGESFVLETLA